MFYEPVSGNTFLYDGCLTTSTDAQTTSGGEQVKKVLDNVILDPGGNYNSALSRYVVRKNGTYFIAAFARTPTMDASGFIRGHIMKNAAVELQQVAKGYEDPYGWYWGVANCVQVSLVKDDYIEYWIYDQNPGVNEWPAGIDNCGLCVVRLS